MSLGVAILKVGWNLFHWAREPIVVDGKHRRSLAGCQRPLAIAAASQCVVGRLTPENNMERREEGVVVDPSRE